MSTGIKLSYYPGCTLKTKARNLEEAALGALKVLGVEYQELPRWNCCGAVFSLADDDLIHHVAPIRNLIRAKEQGSDTVVTLCSQCYNTLARANLLVRDDEEKRGTLNSFMDEEKDYAGEVEILHLLTFLVAGIDVDVEIGKGACQREGALVHDDGLSALGFHPQPVFAEHVVRPTVGGYPDDPHALLLLESIGRSRIRDCVSNSQMLRGQQGVGRMLP